MLWNFPLYFSELWVICICVLFNFLREDKHRLGSWHWTRYWWDRQKMSISYKNKTYTKWIQLCTKKVFKPITRVRRERDELLELKWWRKGKSRINWVFKNECIWMEKISQGSHVFFSKSCKVINFQRRPVWLKWQNDNSRKLDFKVAAFPLTSWHAVSLSENTVIMYLFVFAIMICAATIATTVVFNLIHIHNT